MIIKNIVMKAFKNIKSIILIAVLAIVVNLSAQDFSKITKSIEMGDVITLSSYFDSNPELTILDNEAIYSKSQIETILKEFFSINKPTDYKSIHHGNSGNGAFFQIGELSTSTAVFRIYLYAKNINGKFLIQEFRIEEN